MESIPSLTGYCVPKPSICKRCRSRHSCVTSALGSVDGHRRSSINPTWFAVNYEKKRRKLKKSVNENCIFYFTKILTSINEPDT